MFEAKLAALAVAGFLLSLTAYFMYGELLKAAEGMDRKALLSQAKKGSTFYLLDRMGKKRSGFVLAVLVTAMGGIAVGLVLLNNPLAAVLCAALALPFHRKRVELEYAGRRAELEEQAEVALQMIASLYETIGDLVEAMRKAADCVPSPTRDELLRAVVAYHTGKPLKEVLLELAERMESRDFDIFAKSVVLSEVYGANTAEVVSDVAGIIRDRILLREELKNEMKGYNFTTNIFLLFLPVVAGGLIALYPDARHVLTGTFYGKVMVCAIILVEYLAWHLTRTFGSGVVEL